MTSQTSDPFTLLGVPARYDLDHAAVERAYLSRAALLHPDVVGDGSIAESEAAVQLAQLNRAKATLLNDERRANALLAALGGPSKEQDKSLPDGFLFKIMETRQEIEAAIASGDQQQRGRWQQWAQAQRAEYRERVAKLFTASGEARALQAVRTELNAWRYIERLIEQLDPRYDPASRDFAD
ncbi:MAG TPA: iron-sulfur cluster co-chaperone HscB C-terminal domain-containing protein [Phycisphaerales bacterium]|nr:iron-sulfur cluster co-chaperone HscB C-terminal domain-containing protein [Phycisphaerales bacterium]